MPHIKQLRELMKQLEDQLAVCTRCGMCQSVCPLYAETGREADVARGKLALLDALGRQILDDPKGVKARLDLCLLCGSCAANCPSGVNVLEIFIKARAILNGYLGLSPIKKVIFRNILSNPGRFDRLLNLASKTQDMVSKPVSDLLDTSCARIPGIMGDRHFKRLAAEPFHKLTDQRPGPSGNEKVTVLFFTGCLIDRFFPKVGLAALKVLDHHQVGVFIPRPQACCGIPALSSGDVDAFHKMVRLNLAAFEQGNFDVLITACATCTSTIKKLWPLMSQGMSPEEQEKIRDIAERTMDVSQFLVDRNFIEASSPTADAARVTYHDPCHLKKSLGVFKEPRQVISAGKTHQLVEMAEADRCCGMGGSFNIEHYDTSAAIGKKKVDHIIETDAEIVATSCPACMMQITDLLSRNGKRIPVRHPIELYAEEVDRHPENGEIA